MTPYPSPSLTGLATVLAFQFLTVFGVPVNDICRITLDDIDSNNRRFLYNRTSDNEPQRCTYCSEITRTSSNAFRKAQEDQCREKNEKLDLKFDLVPNCKDMDPITCVIPYPIGNGEWVCGCSGVGDVLSGEVLVYTNCTQRCFPGYVLVGDSFGHCGERVPHDQNFPTEFRYGNAECVRSTQEENSDPFDYTLVLGTTIGILLVVVLFIVLSIILCCQCQWCCFRKRMNQKGQSDNTGASTQLQDITEASTQVTQTTTLISADPVEEETSALLTEKVDIEGHNADDLKSQDWKYTEIRTSNAELRNGPLIEKLCERDHSGLLSAELSSGEPISGLNSFPETSPVDEYLNNNVNSCDVQLDNLIIRGSFWNAQCILNERVDDQKPHCYYMVIDILKRIYPDFDKQAVKMELNDLCNGNNPVMAVLFELLKNYPCTIGDIVEWCVENGHLSVVQYLVSEDHETQCIYCKTMKTKALHMESGDCIK